MKKSGPVAYPTFRPTYMCYGSIFVGCPREDCDFMTHILGVGFLNGSLVWINGESETSVVGFILPPYLTQYDFQLVAAELLFPEHRHPLTVGPLDRSGPWGPVPDESYLNSISDEMLFHRQFGVVEGREGVLHLFHASDGTQWGVVDSDPFSDGMEAKAAQLAETIIESRPT